ncbi:MAG: histidine triad nucleotide-binding protein [Proteobacteria bacterium]|nr:histidine triad nucleotide-binding protein [Pseudomonadota bacterium]MDE3208195.1 histidine triad nucleotide-binding protein [Pseudomonadota bacterium]
MMDCIFCRIVEGSLPSRKVYEDEEFLVFHDIHPFAAVHVLIIPKRHVESLQSIKESDEAMLGRLMALAPRIAASLGLESGFRTLINSGVGGGQEVFHLHAHVFGGEGSVRIPT